MIAYKVKLEPDDNGTLLVTSAELPGLVTYGVDRDDALKPCEMDGGCRSVCLTIAVAALEIDTLSQRNCCECSVPKRTGC